MAITGKPDERTVTLNRADWEDIADVLRNEIDRLSERAVYLHQGMMRAPPEAGRCRREAEDLAHALKTIEIEGIHPK